MEFGVLSLNLYYPLRLRVISTMFYLGLFLLFSSSIDTNRNLFRNDGTFVKEKGIDIVKEGAIKV